LHLEWDFVNRLHVVLAFISPIHYCNRGKV
jgi:hypothetical protein